LHHQVSLPRYYGDVNAGESEGYLAVQSFRQRVLRLVAEIPPGSVATYGQIALLAGRPRAARQVGTVLRGLSEGEAERLPWYRVINARGGISTYKVGSGELQRALLEAEGVRFDAEGLCDLRLVAWDGGLKPDLRG
jgi:methylated-DNA-protein-cysteine methyltransferase-like protein